ALPFSAVVRGGGRGAGPPARPPPPPAAPPCSALSGRVARAAVTRSCLPMPRRNSPLRSIRSRRKAVNARAACRCCVAILELAARSWRRFRARRFAALLQDVDQLPLGRRGHADQRGKPALDRADDLRA